MAHELTNFMSFFRSDYAVWKNLVLGFVHSKIMYNSYLERINIIKKV